MFLQMLKERCVLFEKMQKNGKSIRKIGVLGFSAGGHLASSLSTHHDQGIKKSNLEIEKTGCRPDFSILIYPVVTMKYPNVHMDPEKFDRQNTFK